MKKCENELDALNEINKKLRFIYVTLVCGLAIAIGYVLESGVLQEWLKAFKRL